MEELWQESAQMFTTLFQQPKMTQKLLCKPPFKYIFDIITATTGATGFAEGLFNDVEQDTNFYQNKDQKVIYLKKVMDVCTLILREDVVAKPSKIVAGLEPENTNLFLQQVYRAAVSGQDSKPAARKIFSKYQKLVKEGGSIDENAKEPAPTTKDAAPPSEPKKGAKAQQPSEKQPTQKPQDKKQEQQAASAAPQEDPKPKQEDPPPPQTKQADPPQKEALPAEQSAPPPLAKNSNLGDAKDNKPQQQRPPTASKRPPVIKSNVTEVQPQGKVGTGTQGVIMDGGKGGENEEAEEPSNPKPTNSSKPNVNAAKLNPNQHGKFIQDAMKGEQDDVGEKQDKEDNEDEGETGGIKIVRKQKKKDGDKSGGAGSSTAYSSAKTTSDKGESNSSSGSGGIGVDVEVMSNLVQVICQNANPLGKSLDFITDDIESMNTEMKYWHEQYIQSKEKMTNELQVTDETLQPLQDKLAEIDQQTQDMRSQIQNVQSQIIKNQSQIQTLLYSVVASK